MANHKVMQDIEAEDKLLGPLTLKQFGFAAITLTSGYITYLLIVKNAWFMSIPFWPVIIIFGFLAFPWGRDQPTEIWLLAKIRFFVKPRLRRWDQEGLEELVTITVPKKVDDTELTKSFDRDEAKSRLRALAETIDSRGWAIQNANLNIYTVPGNALMSASPDRLMAADTFGLPAPKIVDVHAGDDVLDESNETAQNLGRMLDESTQARRQNIMAQMAGSLQASAQPRQQTNATTISASEEQALLDKIHKERSRPDPTHSRKTLHPLSEQSEKPNKKTKGHHVKHSKKADSETVDTSSLDSTSSSNKTAPGSTSVNPAILNLANNDDLNVETIARQANKANSSGSDEVVISLH